MQWIRSQVQVVARCQCPEEEPDGTAAPLVVTLVKVSRYYMTFTKQLILH